MLPVHGGKLATLAGSLPPREDRSAGAALLLAPNVAQSDHELMQRTRVAQLLLQALIRAGSGELVLATSSSATRDVRQELLALVEVFLAELGDVPVVISARFLDTGRVPRSVFEAGFGLPEALGQNAQQFRRPACHSAGVF